MTNIALNKRILEKDNWFKSELLTDGNFSKYDGNSGFGYCTFPNYCTIDLEKIYDIELIRFLLWDQGARNYKYRLLTSIDKNTWEVYFDTEESGTIGWQNFEFPDKIKVRYIRIHCLWNSANSEFHIVQIEAHENKISVQPQEIKHIIRTRVIQNEISDGLSISKKLRPIVNSIKEFSNSVQGIDKTFFSGIATELEIRIHDVEKIENGMESIRRQIIEPVNNELSTSNRIGKLSIWLGLIGGIVGIFSLLNSIFKWIE